MKKANLQQMDRENKKMSWISVKIGELSGGDIVKENCPQNFPKNCIGRLLSIAHLVLVFNIYICVI